MVDTTKQAASNVADTSKNAVDTAKEQVTQAQQNVQNQASTSTTSSTPATNGTASALTSASSLASATTVAGDAISTIPGIEPEIQSKLEAQGIHTRQQLLEQTRTKEERGELAQIAEISTHMLRMLSDRAEFLQLQGVTPDVAVMLEEAGVNGNRDLRRRNPEHLYTTLSEAHSAGNIATSVPDIDQLTQWIAEAMAVTSSQE